LVEVNDERIYSVFLKPVLEPFGVPTMTTYTTVPELAIAALR
jgi:hypothetical protein